MKTVKKTIMVGIFVMTMLFGCDREKNDKNGPIYRGEKGVVIRGSNNKDDDQQMNGYTDSLRSDSLLKQRN